MPQLEQLSSATHMEALGWVTRWELSYMQIHTGKIDAIFPSTNKFPLTAPPQLTSAGWLAHD